MYFKRALVILLGCIILFASCELPCLPASSLLGLVSFTDAEADSLVIRKFAKGSGFSSPVETLLFQRNQSHFLRRGDTLLLLEASGDIESAYDYEIYLPRAARVFRLNEIHEPQTWDRHRKTACINAIRSYRQDGVLVAGADQYDRIYLDK